MRTARTRTFRSGSSEAIRLPEVAAFGEDVELIVVRSGDVLTVYPTTTSPAELVATLDALPVPTAIECRDVDELPERPSL